MLGGSPDNASQSQMMTKIIVAGGVVLVIIAFLLILPNDNKKAQANAGDRFRLVDDSGAAKTNWVGEASKTVQATNADVQKLELQNAQLLQRLTALEAQQKKDAQTLKEAQNARANQPTNPYAQSANANYPPVPSQDKSIGEKFIERQLGNVDSAVGALVKKERITEFKAIPNALHSEKTGEKLIEKKNEVAKAPSLPPIPAGSIVPVVSITGVDAPTMQAAKSQPLPMLWRVTDLSIIPNAHNLDLVGCHIMGEAAGDMSSERVYVRTNILTCVDGKGKLYEAGIAGYVAGSDSKNGVRGKLVTKQGQLLAKALIAAFLDGVAQAFSQKDQITMASAIGTTTTTGNTGDRAMLEASGYRGLSTAASRLSDFYLEMADQVFPIIELDGGVEAHIIVTETKEIVPYQSAQKEQIGVTQ
jgi:conjugal transfer pilus assembly protein TraB